jgi:GNAT superfamily N-acetyltransferase
VPEIRTATTTELDQVGQGYADAFADDPIYQWLVPDRSRWEASAASWFTAHARREVRHDAVAMGVPSLRLYRDRLRTAARLMGRMERMHPKAEHWYLAMLGVRTGHQGTGVGGSLIRSVTDRCDAEGMAAYLETGKRDNVAYYVRHGFAVQDEIRVSGGPPMWLMWRLPQP